MIDNHVLGKVLDKIKKQEALKNLMIDTDDESFCFKKGLI